MVSHAQHCSYSVQLISRRAKRSRRSLFIPGDIASGRHSLCRNTLYYEQIYWHLAQTLGIRIAVFDRRCWSVRGGGDDLRGYAWILQDLTGNAGADSRYAPCWHLPLLTWHGVILQTAWKIDKRPGYTTNCHWFIEICWNISDNGWIGCRHVTCRHAWTERNGTIFGRSHVLLHMRSPSIPQETSSG